MKKFFAAVILALVTVAFANADVINVSFQGDAGPEDSTTLVGPAGGSGETWNQPDTMTGSSLLDSGGTPTSVGYNISADNAWNWGAPELTMIQGGRSYFGKGTDTTLTINGLTPDNLYNVYVASYAHNTGLQERALGEWSTSNPTTTVGSQMIDARAGLNGTTWEYGLNYVLFENVAANGSGEISLLGDAADGGGDYGETYNTRLPVSGWQIEDAAPIPEPSALALLGLGAVVILLRRRRK